ncbi:MAG: acetyl-CoA carboxylase biotin carboxyl carrier protein [Planctomycetota bacterium]
MDLSDIRKLVQLMQRAELSEIEIDDSNTGLRIHLKRGPAGGGGASVGASLPSVVQLVPGSGAAVGGMPAAIPAGAPAAAESAPPAGLPPGTITFPSPMVGTFYRAPAPDADPYVDVGSRIDEDTVLCIVEAMKVMNEIKAEMRGEIVDVLVENGEPVEFGQPLFHIKKS